MSLVYARLVLAPGQLLARRYRIEARLGQGGMAQALLARDLLADEPVTLKVLRSDSLEGALRAEFERIREHAHPCLLRVRELSRARHDGRMLRFYSSDFVPGQSLNDHAAQHGFAGSLGALADVLEALHVLHRHGLRHGDVKPDNVVVRAGGRAVLIDLGCAAALHTAERNVSGTPGYMAPELLEGRLADERADLFAFGVMLRELFASALPAPISSLVARLTEHDVALRPASVREVLACMGVQRDVERHVYTRAPRLLGRERELGEAQLFFQAFVAGAESPRVLWVHGPDGVGRSRMLRELSFAWSTEAELLEARAVPEQGLRAALARGLGELEPGPEGFVAAVEELAEGDLRQVLLLDDADQLTGEAREELTWLVRTLPASGRALLLVASREPPPRSLAGRVQQLPLAALDEQALAGFCDGLLPRAAVPRLLAHTGGFPREVEAVLEALASGRLTEASLGRAPSGPSERRGHVLAAALIDLADAPREWLERVLVYGPVQDPPEEVAAVLAGRSLARVEQGQLVLVRAGDAEPLSRLLDGRSLRRLHAGRARELSVSDAPDQVALTIGHWLSAGEPARALSLLERAAQLVPLAPLAFARALSGHEARLAPAHLLVLARAARLLGDSERALGLLAHARRRVDPSTLAPFTCEAAEVYLALGKPQRSLRFVMRLASDPSVDELELRARVLSRTGQHGHALSLAEQALALDPSHTQRARVCETLAMAEAQLGRHDEALAHVQEAAQLHMGEQDARAALRCEAFRGFVLLRAGRVTEASEAYAKTGEQAEQHGFADLLVNALMNLGSARHMLGSYGAALTAYERALRLARALGRSGSVRLLRLNLANVSLEVGSFARAERELAQLASEHREGELPSTLALYQAELALCTGDPARALAALDHVGHEGREQQEALLLRGEALLAAGALDDAATCVEELSRNADAGALDVRVRASELRADLALARKLPEQAVTLLEQALRAARPSAQEPLLARLEAALSRTYVELRSPGLAEEYGLRARARMERMALDLPASLRDAFWSHPRRRALASAHDSSKDQPRGRSTVTLTRLLDINRRINSSLTVSDVLEHAMDAAIELMLAERGFVLLRSAEGVLKVAIGRHLSGEQLKRREHKLSRSIAERVVQSGEAVWTVDAGSDARFARQASVHAMRLKSVLCVPIRSPAGVIGAMYLDNNVERARFAAGDAELLLAFADQVAIALHNAELVAELEQRSRELAREKRRVEELLRGKTEEVARLEQALSVSRAAFETRYDYSQIVGRSAPMRRVLGVLDRVIESDVGVLIMGESGTGKELVARAIHAHGLRKQGPFVGLNCAALPEQLLEAELFGHVKGAFTGADRDRPGLLRAAHGGTMFLDELGEMSLAMQAKLLRVLVDREVRPVGATRSFSVDVRFVCATNRDLEQRVRTGAFREDLYYRVAVVSVTMPPLRERSEDIVPIAQALLEKRAQEQGCATPKLSPEAVRMLLAHPWPGNVRELENTLVRASVMTQGSVIRAEDLGLGRAEERTRRTPTTRKDFEQLEAQRLLAALEAERWNVSQVARNLGIPRNTLYRKLVRYGIRT